MINNATHYFIFGLYLFISSEFATTDTELKAIAAAAIYKAEEYHQKFVMKTGRKVC